MIKQLINKLTYIWKKDLIKVFRWTSLSTSIKILSQIIKAKILAVTIGPVGIAYLGQLSNFVRIFSTVSTGGIEKGLTKYIAEYKDSENEYLKYFSSGMLIVLVFSAISSIVLILFSGYFSNKLFQTAEYQSVIVIFSITIFALALNKYLLAITNGFKEFRRFIGGDIIRNIVVLIISITMVLLYDLYGALLSVIISQSIVLIITIIVIHKLPWFKIRNFKPVFEKVASKKLLSFSLLSAATFFLGPMADLLRRSFIINKLSVEQAGYWDGAVKLSGYVLMVITQALTVYLVPRFSELKNKREIKKETLNTYKIIVPILIFGYSFVFIFRNTIIKVLLSESFLPMGDLLLFQFIGDSVRIISWVISIQLIAKAMIKTLLVTEIIFNILVVILAYIGILVFGLQGVVIGYTINYCIYLITMLYIFRKTLFIKY